MLSGFLPAPGLDPSQDPWGLSTLIFQELPQCLSHKHLLLKPIWSTFLFLATKGVSPRHLQPSRALCPLPLSGRSLHSICTCQVSPRVHISPLHSSLNPRPPHFLLYHIPSLHTYGPISVALKLEGASERPGGLLAAKPAGPTPRVSDAVGQR